MTADFTPDRIDRALAIIAACGADPARWPDEDHASVLELAEDPAVAAALAEARRLDALIDGWATAPTANGIDAEAIAALPQQLPVSKPIAAPPPPPAPARGVRAWLAGSAMAAAAATMLILAIPQRVDPTALPIAGVGAETMASAGSAVTTTPGGAGDADFAAVFTPTADEEDLI